VQTSDLRPQNWGKRLCSALVFAATLTLPITSKAAACEFEYRHVGIFFRPYTSNEEYWRIFNTWLPSPKDVCNAEILEIPKTWTASAEPAALYLRYPYSNGYRYSSGYSCHLTDGDSAQSDWDIEARCKAGLTLTPVPQTAPDPRPKGAEGKDGKSTLDLIAKVTDGSGPKAGVAVTFKITADYASGGHAGHSGTRPTGTVPASGVTDANGEFKLQFKSSEFAGSEIITATCTECSNKTAAAPVQVKVPDFPSSTANRVSL
jgi:hypothetical protein